MNGLLVFCNVPDRAVAETLATALLVEHLAACVNILAPCRSMYRWDGRLECAEEIPLLIKTSVAVYPALEARIKSLHPYQVPEIVACQISHGLPSYLTWVEQEVFQGVTALPPSQTSV